MGSNPRRFRSEFKSAQSDAAAVHHSPTSVQFSVFSKEEIKALSSCSIDNPNCFNQVIPMYIEVPYLPEYKTTLNIRRIGVLDLGLKKKFYYYI